MQEKITNMPQKVTSFLQGNTSCPRRGYKNAVKIFPLPHANCQERDRRGRRGRRCADLQHQMTYIFLRTFIFIFFIIFAFSRVFYLFLPPVPSSLFYALAFIFFDVFIFSTFLTD